MRALAFVVLLAGCEPVWGVDVRVRHPAQAPIDEATVALACAEGTYPTTSMAVRTRSDGTAFVGGMGHTFPVGCDVFVAKPGYATQRIRYRDLCPNGPDACDRVFAFDLVLVPAPQ